MKPHPAPTRRAHLENCARISDALTEYVNELYRQAVERMHRNWNDQ